MTSMQDYIDQFKAAKDSLPGDALVQAGRAAAITALSETGLPTRKWEDWRYTDLGPLTDKPLRANASAAEINDAAPASVSGWPRLVISGGVLNTALSDPLPEGAELIEGDALAASPPSWAEPLFQPGLQAFSNMNLAFARSAFALRVPEGKKIEGVEIIFLHNQADDSASHCRGLIVLEQGAEMNLFMRHLGPSDAFKGQGWANVDLHIKVANDAKLHSINHCDTNAAAFLSINEQAELQSGTYENISFCSDVGSYRHEITADIRAAGAHAELLGARLAAAKSNLDTLTRVHHHIGNATSNQLFRSVAADGGKTAFQGRVRVEQDAQQTFADQACNNLVLDNHSEANVKPELLIFADDVKCSHGATVGELDKDALFYLVQRGVDPQTARSILIAAFLGEVLEAIENDAIRAFFEEQTEAWMSTGSKGGYCG